MEEEGPAFAHKNRLKLTGIARRRGDPGPRSSGKIAESVSEKQRGKDLASEEGTEDKHVGTLTSFFFHRQQGNTYTSNVRNIKLWNILQTDEKKIEKKN